MRLKYKTREALTGLGFIAIWIIGFLVFTLIPLIQTFWYSLNNVKVTTEGIKTTFVGLSNYKQAFLLDVTFVDTLLNYVMQLVIVVPVIIVFAIIVSLLLNTNIKGRGIFRTIYFLPVIITSGPVIKKLMDEGATTFPGMEKFIKMSEIQQSFPPLIVTLITFLISSFIIILWFSGVQILIFIAGLQKLDKSMYEAASIDGASRWEAFWKLTLPAMNPLIVVNIVYTVVMYSIFALNPIIGIIEKAMYSPSQGFGYSSALSWIYFVVLLIILGIFVAVTALKDKKIKHVV
jgi:ABC-type sugar transport system permease subunit